MNRRHRVHPRILPWLLIAALLVSGCSAGGPDPSVAAPTDRTENPGQTADPQMPEDPAGPDNAADDPAGAGGAEDPPVAGAVPADLDGDGAPEWIRGLTDTWTADPVEIYDAQGEKLLTWETFGWERKVSLHSLPGQPRAVLLEWRRFEDGQTAVGIQAFVRRSGTFAHDRLYGWGLKHAETTPAHRASFTEDGALLVEWDMGDPARHTRIRRYALNLEQGSVAIVEERFVPEGSDLVYPEAPEAVLHAAQIAAAYRLEDELPRYFASTDVAGAFLEAIPPWPYEVTGVELASVTAFDEYCVPTIEPAQPDADGKAPFVVWLAGQINLIVKVGTVWFETDDAGRTIIRDFRLDEGCA